MNQSSTHPRLEAIRYTRGRLELLDQLKLPLTTEFFSVPDCEQAADAIKTMKVRGAPAIAVTAALSLAVEVKRLLECSTDLKNFIREVEARLVLLGNSRPTAVNLFEAIGKLRNIVDSANQQLPNNSDSATRLADQIISYAEGMMEKDLADNRAIGGFGADLFKTAASSSVNILTHCNTGSLATVGYGTALGVIRALHERGQLAHAYATETRPYNQGARLTAFELVFEKIPATLITDSMASFLMKKHNIHAVVVGADRVVANGDTANKIGTYQLAIAARFHSVPFYVAAPLTSIDVSTSTGDGIHIEQRPARELTHISGTQLAAEGIGVWNPSFDVTPASLISGIITEQGVIHKGGDSQSFAVADFINRLKK